MIEIAETIDKVTVMVASLTAGDMNGRTPGTADRRLLFRDLMRDQTPDLWKVFDKGYLEDFITDHRNDHDTIKRLWKLYLLAHMTN